MTFRYAIGLTLWSFSTTLAAENWPGYEGGNLHHNSSAVDIDIAKLPAGKALWDVRFDHPVDCRTTNPGFFGSRNLVLLDGHIAIVAANTTDGKDLSGFHRGGGKDDTYPYISILRASDGKVVNCISTTIQTGPRRAQMMYPTSNYMEAYDTGIGITVLAWDPQTKILFARNGGDNPTNNAYLPLANLAEYKGTGWQKSVGAYDEIFTKHPDFKDADGNVRKDKEIPGDAKRVLDGDQWDYGTVKPVFNNQPNSTAFFEVDGASGLLAAAISPAHAQACGYFLANKYTGLYAKVGKGAYERPAGKEWFYGKTTFAKWGGIRVGNGRVFFMGPCDDTAGDGFMSSFMKPDAPDQGLRLASYKVEWKDQQDNGGYTGPGKDESAVLTPEWEQTLHSPHKPTSAEDAESYLDLDAFYRNKTWLVDGECVWGVWKKSKADPAELFLGLDCGTQIRAFPLPFGQGQRGQDIWGHLSFIRTVEDRILVYYAGNGLYRKYEGKGKWAASTEKPLGPAFICVAKWAKVKRWGSVLNAADGSGPHPTLLPNEAEGYFDRSAMVVAGEHALVAWVEAGPTPGSTGILPVSSMGVPPMRPTGVSPVAASNMSPASSQSAPNAATAAPALSGNCILHVLSFDITAEKAPTPVEFTYDLGIPKGSNRQTCVFDMMAADGVLYVLVTESDTLDSGHHTWKAQRVIALGSTGK